MDRPDISFLHSRLVDWFLSPQMREATSYEAYNKRAVVLTSLWMLACGVAFAPLYGFVFGQLAIVLGVIGCCVGGLIGLSAVRLTDTTLWASNIICTVLASGLVWLSLQTGGIQSAPAFWILLVPIVARSFYHRRGWTYFWTAVAIAALGLVYGLTHVGRASSILSPGQNQLLFFCGTIGLLIAVLQIVAIRHGIETWLLESAHRREAERREAESELRRAHEEARERTRQNLRALIENSPDGIIIHQDERIVYANPAARRLVGYDEDELTGMPIQELADVDDLPDVERRIAELHEKSVLHALETNVVHRNGDRIAVEITAFTGTFDGRTAIISILRDLSERRELRARMMQMNRMVAVGTLAAGAAHEINNPLTFVRSNLQYLDSQLGGDETAILENMSAAEAREVIDDAVDGSKRIASIVSDLTTFSSGEQSHKPEPTDIEQTLESAIKMARNQIRNRAHLQRDYEDLPTIESKRSELAQVFLNLLVNAAQAIPPGTPDEHEIRVATRLRDDEVIVEISDTGEGIDEKTLPHIFDPFFSTKPQDQAMGLGLSISQNIVRALGGSIDVESREGDGSTFRVTLPTELPDAARRSTASTHSPFSIGTPTRLPHSVQEPS